MIGAFMNRRKFELLLAFMIWLQLKPTMPHEIFLLISLLFVYTLSACSFSDTDFKDISK